MGVIRLCISVPKAYKERLDKGSKELGISKSELVRRAIDDYLSKLGLL